MIRFGFILVAVVIAVHADVYLQTPRGSNNRLNGNRRERRNGARLFDSQNNARGGYNVGNLYYYAGTVLPIEWTNQHSCGGDNNDCQLVLQYMCHDKLRDGSTTSTIPEHKHRCQNHDCNSDIRYGMQETYDSYMECKIRDRNPNYFIADQKLKYYTARYTRQNPNGNRRGYECPEEKDYYPYHQPTMWKDIAIMTNDDRRCKEFQAESQNVKERYSCVPPAGYVDAMVYGSRSLPHNSRKYLPLNEIDCKKIEWPLKSGKFANWTKTEAWGISAPDCIKAPKSRDNHNGNGAGAFPNMYNWTIPSDFHENCVLRIRYNISTSDYNIFPERPDLPDYQQETPKLQNLMLKNGYPVEFTQNFVESYFVKMEKENEPCPMEKGFCVMSNNRDQNSGVIKLNSQDGNTKEAQDKCFKLCREFPGATGCEVIWHQRNRGCYVHTQQIARGNGRHRHYCWVFSKCGSEPFKPDIGSLVGLDEKKADERGYVLKSNPIITPFVDGNIKIEVQLAINTAQFGRTFQDRSHSFSIRKRPADLQGKTIHNLNVRGKRGNIVQTYPATEYDYVPNRLEAKVGDYIHFQWTGSDTNPHNNAGNGRRGTDRSNIVLLKGQNYPEGTSGVAVRKDLKFGHWGNSYAEHLDNVTFLGFPRDDLRKLGLGHPFRDELSQLDEAMPYFDLGPKKVTTDGEYVYMCTRNNDFTNRSQKAKIVVKSASSQNDTEEPKNEEEEEESDYEQKLEEKRYQEENIHFFQEDLQEQDMIE